MFNPLLPDWRGCRIVRHEIRLDERKLLVICRKVVFGHEIRWYWFDDQTIPIPVFSQDVLNTTPGTNFTYTSNSTWINTSNSVECIGAGAKGAIGSGVSASGGGGGAGAFTKVFTNGANAGFQFATPGTTTAVCRVGLGEATNGATGGDTWVNDTAYPTTGTNKVGAKGAAALVSGTTSTGGAGGLASGAYTSGFTNPVVSDGGSGGTAGAANNAAGAGGGAGGPFGAGASPGTGPTAGGTADNTRGGAGGAAGNPAVAGGIGKEWSQLVGCGGGGGSANASGGTGGDGGNFGGGSGGGARSTGVSGTPANGSIILSWPVYVRMPLSLAMQPVLAQ